jgi:hypothetical protein
LPLLIAVGVLSGYPVQGATAAGAAFAVGFGAAREIRGQRWAAMLLAMLGMSIAAFAGTLLGQESWAFVGCASAAAAGCAALALYDEDLWWVVLQLVIVFFVAGYYDGDLHAATERFAMTLLGGTVQIGIAVGLAQLFPAASQPFIVPSPPVHDRRILIAHMSRAAICVGASLLAIHPLQLANGYWAPMTALLVLKPHLHETRARGLARLGGTIGGCVLATGFATLFHDRSWLMVAGATLTATAAFALQKAHYASLTVAITATIVLLLTVGAADPLSNAEHRLIATVVGGSLALLVAALFPHTLPRRRVADRVGSSLS